MLKTLAFPFTPAATALMAMLLAGCQSAGKNPPPSSVAAMPSAPGMSSVPNHPAAKIPWPDAAEVRGHMKAAFTPELKDVLAAAQKRPGLARDWQQAVFYIGVSAAWKATGDDDYRTALLQWGERVNWQPGPRPRHADDLACGQAFIEVFQREGGPERIAAVRARVDAFLASPKPGHEDWSWCDSFFMAPPVFVKLAAATGDAHYREAMHPLFQDAIAALWDKQNGLFYRDNRFVRAWPSVFWARGNGWVLAGLARVIDGLPAGDPARPCYEELFKILAVRIVQLQAEDGAWRADLLDPDEYPAPESSSTALFAYGLAWGVNHGLLSNADYAPAVLKAWAALKRAQLPDGRLGSVQPKGDRPDDTEPTDTAPYGGGAFLLLGSELLPPPDVKPTPFNPPVSLPGSSRSRDTSESSYMVAYFPPKPLPASKAVLVKDGMTLQSIVAALGKGWVSPDEGVGVIHWYFDDGRVLNVLPWHSPLRMWWSAYYLIHT